jgi:hypothetical protein
MGINPFDHTFGLGKRGAYGDLPPMLGSSNLSKAIPLAGRFAFELQPNNNLFPAPTATPGAPAAQIPGAGFNPYGLSSEDLAKVMREKPLDYALAVSLNRQQEQNTPEARAAERKQYLQDQLAYNKEQGDQQMKYRMMNDIIANIGSGARAAVSRYSDPAALAASLGTVGDSYARASASTAHLAQLGAGQPSRQYFTA